MLLRLGMHVRRTDSNERRTAIAYFLALFIVLLAEGLSQQLDVPLRNGFEVITIRHHDLNVTAMFLSSSELQCRIEHSRVLPDIVVLASLVHILGTVEECLDVKADAGSQRQADLAEDREAPADTVWYSILRPAFFDSQLLQQRLFLHVRIRYRYDLDIDALKLLQGIIDDHEVRHRIERAAGFRDDEQQYLEIAFLMALRDGSRALQIVDDIARAARIDVLAAEYNFREAVALLFGHRIPELAAMDIKENLVTKIRAADTQRNHNIHIVLDMVCELLQVLHRTRAVQMALFDIRQLAEQNFLRLTIL